MGDELEAKLAAHVREFVRWMTSHDLIMSAYPQSSCVVTLHCNMRSNVSVHNSIHCFPVPSFALVLDLRRR